MKQETREALELLVAIKNQSFIWFSNYNTEYRVINNIQMAVIKNDTLVKWLGTSVCAVIGNGVVVADNKFYSLSPEIQQFILLHELGHLQLQHKISKYEAWKRLLLIIKGGVMEKELEADRYATAATSKDTAIAALSTIKTLIPGILARVEIQRRINALS